MEVLAGFLLMENRFFMKIRLLLLRKEGVSSVKNGLGVRVVPII